MTSSNIALSRYSDAVAFRSPPASIKIPMHMRKSLFAWKGNPLSTYLVTNGHALKGVGERVHQGEAGADSPPRPIDDTSVCMPRITSAFTRVGLVLVHLRARSMT